MIWGECWTLTLQASFHFFFPWFQSLPCNFFRGERESQASRVWQIWGSTGSTGRWEVHRVHFVQRICRSVIARESSWKQLTFRHQLKRREKKWLKLLTAPILLCFNSQHCSLKTWICRSTSQATCYPSMKPAPTRWRPLKRSENTFDDMLHLECVMTLNDGEFSLRWGIRDHCKSSCIWIICCKCMYNMNECICVYYIPHIPAAAKWHSQTCANLRFNSLLDVWICLQLSLGRTSSIQMVTTKKPGRSLMNTSLSFLAKERLEIWKPCCLRPQWFTIHEVSQHELGYKLGWHALWHRLLWQPRCTKFLGFCTKRCSTCTLEGVSGYTGYLMIQYLKRVLARNMVQLIWELLKTISKWDDCWYGLIFVTGSENSFL